MIHRTSADMQHSKVRKGICAANLNDVVLWRYNYIAAQKAVAQKPPPPSADMQHRKVRKGICRKDGTSRAAN